MTGSIEDSIAQLLVRADEFVYLTRETAMEADEDPFAVPVAALVEDLAAALRAAAVVPAEPATHKPRVVPRIQPDGTIGWFDEPQCEGYQTGPELADWWCNIHQQCHAPPIELAAPATTSGHCICGGRSIPDPDCEATHAPDQFPVPAEPATHDTLRQAQDLARRIRGLDYDDDDPELLADLLDLLVPDSAVAAVDGEAPAGVRQSERMNLNPEPLRVVDVPTCRKCRKRAPWCSCVDGPDYGEAPAT